MLNISCVDRTDPVGLEMYRTWLGCSHFSGTVALWIMHGISDLPLRKDSIQGDGIVLGTGPMGPIFLMWIGQFLGVLECTVRDWDAAIFSVQLLFEPYSIFQNQGTPSCLGAASSCPVWPRLAWPCHALSCLAWVWMWRFFVKYKKWYSYGGVV